MFNFLSRGGGERGSEICFQRVPCCTFVKRSLFKKIIVLSQEGGSIVNF